MSGWPMCLNRPGWGRGCSASWEAPRSGEPVAWRCRRAGPSAPSRFNRGGGRPASGGRPRAGLRTPKMGTRRKFRKPNRNDVGKSQIANPNQGGAFPPIPLSEGREVRRPADGGALRGPRRASPLRFPFLPRRPAGAPAMPGRLERDSRPRPSSESTGSAQSSRQVFFRVDRGPT